MVKRLSDRYLADVSAAMDPARSPEVLAAVPPERAAAVTVELARRGEWVVIGGVARVLGGGNEASADESRGGPVTVSFANPSGVEFGDRPRGVCWNWGLSRPVVTAGDCR